MQSTLNSCPEYHPWPSSKVTPWFISVAMALAISCHFLEKMRNCTDSLLAFIT